MAGTITIHIAYANEPKSRQLDTQFASAQEQYRQSHLDFAEKQRKKLLNTVSEGDARRTRLMGLSRPSQRIDRCSSSDSAQTAATNLRAGC